MQIWPICILAMSSMHIGHETKKPMSNMGPICVLDPHQHLADHLPHHQSMPTPHSAENTLHTPLVTSILLESGQPLMVRGCEEPSVGALDSHKPGGHMLVKLAVHMSLRLRMSVVTSRAMTSNALTSKTELDGDVAVAVSFGVLSACGGSRITCCVRTMATTVSFILLCLWQSSVPYTKRRSKAIWVIQYANWLF